MRRLATFSLVLALAFLAGCGTSIAPGRLGLANNAFGKPGLQKELKVEGFHFQWPWNHIITYDVTWQIRSEEVETLTADDLHVPTKVSVIFRARPTELYKLHTQIGPTYYEDIVRPRFMTLVRSEFAKYMHNDLARKSPSIEAAIRTTLLGMLDTMPIDIGEIAIEHIQFDKTVTVAISEKLVMEQKAEQKSFEITIAEEDAEIARATAQGRGDAIRIQAEGEAQAIVLRATAQSEAQKLIVKTLTRNYLQYKAFDGSATRYYFVPVGKDGLPLIIDAK